MATYDWFSELGHTIVPIKSKVGTFDEIRHMDVNELKAFTRQSENKAANDRVFKAPFRANNSDRVISSQLLYARNRLRLSS